MKKKRPLKIIVTNDCDIYGYPQNVATFSDEQWEEIVDSALCYDQYLLLMPHSENTLVRRTFIEPILNEDGYIEKFNRILTAIWKGKQVEYIVLDGMVKFDREDYKRTNGDNFIKQRNNEDVLANRLRNCLFDIEKILKKSGVELHAFPKNDYFAGGLYLCPKGNKEVLLAVSGPPIGTLIPVDEIKEEYFLPHTGRIYTYVSRD